MSIEAIVRPFAAIGAELKIETVEPSQGGIGRRRITVAQRIALQESYALDVQEKPGKECYQLIVRADAIDSLEFQAVDIRPDLRHLVLMARAGHAAAKRKYLCGHDERMVCCQCETEYGFQRESGDGSVET